MDAALSVVHVQRLIVCGGDEIDIREPGTTGSIHKDILLDQFHQDYVTSCGTDYI